MSFNLSADTGRNLHVIRNIKFSYVSSILILYWKDTGTMTFDIVVSIGPECVSDSDLALFSDDDSAKVPDDTESSETVVSGRCSQNSALS